LERFFSIGSATELYFRVAKGKIDLSRLRELDHNHGIIQLPKKDVSSQKNKPSLNNNHKDAELIIGGYNMYIEQLEKEVKELNTNPQKLLMNLYQFSGFSSKFIEERKVLCSQTVQLAIQKKDEYIISEMNKKALNLSNETVSQGEYELNYQLNDCEDFLKKFQKYNSSESYNLIKKRKEEIIKNINLIAGCSCCAWAM
jgi:hypothetical protein